MKKKLLIITANSAAKIGMLSYLTSIFGRYLTVISSRAEDAAPKQVQSADCILYTTQAVKSSMKIQVNESTRQIVCIRTFNHTYLHKLLQIPPGSFVYLVNDFESSAYGVIHLLREFGFTQYHFLPWYPGCGPVSPDIHYAVTAGETQLVPKEIPTVIDIGIRVADISTINEIIAYFQLPLSIADEITKSYINHIVQILRLSNQQLSRSLDSQHISGTIINNVDCGVCLVDYTGNIHMANPAFCKMLSIYKTNLSGQNLEEILKTRGLSINLHETRGYTIWNIRDTYIRMWIQEIDTLNSSRMYLLHTYEISGKLEESEPVQEMASNPASGESTFEAFVTQDLSMKQMIDKAKRISLNDFHVILYGESTTEKKLLARAIHNNSKRHGKNFVVFDHYMGENPEHMNQILISSNQGTLFIDRMEQMSLPVQSLLLSVLQNGFLSGCSDGNAERPVLADIRIIAAAGEDLYERVQEGKFLKELFFTLNVTCLETLPLRSRRDDLDMMLDWFIRNVFHNSDISSEHILSESLIEYLKSYQWPGNELELENLCKYFFTVYSGKPLTLQDLPSYMKAQLKVEKPQLTAGELQILEIIRNHPRVGRNTVLHMLNDQTGGFTENRVRKVLKDLSASGFILVHRTRGGCEITEQGLMALL